MENLLPENLQEILVRLNVRDLIRCKSVCKSWLSFISDPQFVRAHLNRSYLLDRNDHEIGHRRIVLSKYANFYVLQQYEIDNHLFDYNRCHLLGSSDGLVCLSPSHTEIVVVNPLIREVYKLAKPQIPDLGPYGVFYWGFGHDSLSNEYKVVLGWKGKNCTHFQIFSLKSENWKHIGEVNYILISRIGVLCKGALHWVAYDTTTAKYILLSFHLSKETFLEIPQPQDRSYLSRVAQHSSRVAQHSSMRLGTMEDCLCVFRYDMLPNDIWVMREYNVKNSWEVFGHGHKIKYEAIHCIKPFKNYIPYIRPFCHETCWLRSQEYIGAPIYVESLVSPHIHSRVRRPKRKWRTNSTTTITSPPEVMLNNNTRASYAGAGHHAYAVPQAYDGNHARVIPHAYPSHYDYAVPRAIAGHQVYAFPHAIAGHLVYGFPHAIAGHHPNIVPRTIAGRHPNAIFPHVIGSYHANALPHAVIGYTANSEAGAGSSSSASVAASTSNNSEARAGSSASVAASTSNNCGASTSGRV